MRFTRALKIVALMTIFLCLCNVVFYVGAEIYDAQLPDYSHFVSASDLEAHFESLISVGQVKRSELGALLNGIGLQNYSYGRYEDDVMTCRLRAPRGIWSGYPLAALMNAIFVRKYYSLRFVFEGDIVARIIVVDFNDTPVL